MSYHFPFILSELQSNLTIFQTLLLGAEEVSLWKPSPERWCLLEVVCHLYDEEREDFRYRIEHVFTRPGKPLTPIDPSGWVEKRHYLRQDFTLQVKNFFAEREYSLSWLRGRISTIPPASWDCVIDHPEIGEISAYGFLENWLGHDYLHIRQIMDLKFEYWQQLSGNDFGYARE